MSKKPFVNVWGVTRERQSCDPNSEGSWILVKLGTTASGKPISQQMTSPALGPKNFIPVDEEMRPSRPYPSVQAPRRGNQYKRYGFGNRESFADENSKSSEIVQKKMTLGLSRQPANSSNNSPSWQATNVKVPAKRKFTAPRQVPVTQPKVVKPGSLFGNHQNLARSSRADGQAAAVQSLQGLTSVSRCDARDLKPVVSTKGWNEQDVSVRSISGRKALDAGHEADIGQSLFQFASGKIVHPTAGAISRAYALLRDEPEVDREPSTPESFKARDARDLKPVVSTKGWNEQDVSVRSISGRKALDAGHEADIGQPLFQFASGKIVHPTAGAISRAYALLRDEPEVDREPSTPESFKATEVLRLQKQSEDSRLKFRQLKPLVPPQQWKERSASLENSHGAEATDVGQEADAGQSLFQFASGNRVRPSAAAHARAQALLGEDSDADRESSSQEEGRATNSHSVHELKRKSRGSFRHPKPLVTVSPWKERRISLENRHHGE